MRSSFQEKKIYQRICQGDERALKQLMDVYRSKFERYAKQRFPTLRTDECRDVFSDAVIKFYERVQAGTFVYEESSSSKRDKPIQAFLFAVGTNLLNNGLDRQQVRSRHKERLTSFLNLNTGSQDRYTNEAQQALIKKAMYQLSERDRKILTLFFFHRYDMESIAQAMNLGNANSAKTTKLRALNRLRAILKAHYKKEDLL